MTHVLALGREVDLHDYIAYCRERGIQVTCLQPPALQLGDVARWDSTMRVAYKAAGLQGKPDHVVSFHDAFQVQVDVLKRILGLPHRRPEAVFTLTDKSAFKAVPATADYISRYVRLPQTVSTEQGWAEVEKALSLPVVVKPSNAFYSAGVVRIDDHAHWSKALAQARRVCQLMGTQRGGSEILVEEYIDGEEFSVDGYVLDGVVIPLLLHQKHPRLVGPTFHEHAQMTRPFDLARGTGFQAALRQVLGALGLDQSPFHAEFRRTDAGRLYVLEIAPRISGGGISSRYLMDICLGLDVHEVEFQLHQPGLRLKLPRRRIGLEYDFSVRRSGVLKDIEKTVAQCREAGATVVVQHRANGEFVMAPPVNCETVLTAFFACDSESHAMRTFDLMETCTLETEAS